MDWSWEIAGIIVGVVSGLSGTVLGVWSRLDRRQDRKLALAAESREDRDFRKRNSADLRMVAGGPSGKGHIGLAFTNEGDHRATNVKGTITVGDIQRPLDDASLALAPQETKRITQIFLGLGSVSGGKRYEDMVHLLPGAVVEATYTDGLGDHHRRWKVLFEPRGEYFHEWKIIAEPLEG